MYRRAPLLFCLAFVLFAAFQAEAQQFYWERPEILVDANASFVRSSSNGERSAFLWHEYGEPSDGYRDLYISLMSYRNTWERHERVLGPFRYVGEKVPVASMVIDKAGHIFIALATSGNTIAIYRSDDDGASFVKVAEPGIGSEERTVVAPRLFLSSTGSLVLFVTSPLISEGLQALTSEVSLGAAFSVSRDGREWSEFTSLAKGSNLAYVYLPSLAHYGGKDYVAFQASPQESRFYQLYLVSSSDGGASWSSPRLISDFEDRSISDDGDPNLYDNQRPYLYGNGKGLAVAWERRYSGSSPPQIFYAELSPEGAVVGVPERISQGSNVCRNPVITETAGERVLFWFDDSKGDNRIFFALRRGVSWDAEDVSVMNGVSAFPVPMFRSGELSLLWENSFANRSRIAFLAPDKSASPPQVRPLNFRQGRPAKQDSFIVSWNLPDDSSGISGFSYSVDRDPEGDPPQRLMLLRREERRFSASLKEDGPWFFHVAAQDYAGNWSKSVTIEALRDTTPPSPVLFIDPELDGDGFLPSNTGNIAWEPPSETDVAGYTYRLQYLTSADYTGDPEALPVRPPSDSIRLQVPSLSFRNIDNGLWAVTVAPVDQVGNVGEAVSFRMRLNKYIPVTYVTDISLREDDLGRYLISIVGRGFSVGGKIGTVLLDRDGKPPYDYSFDAESAVYRVVSDRRIEGPVIEDIDGGDYHLGVIHPTRGLYLTRRTLSFSDTGTVKFGDFTILQRPALHLIRLPFSTLSGGTVAFVLVMVLLGASFLFVSWRILRLVQEGNLLRNEAVALLEQRRLPHEERKERIITMAKERKGLRRKFALLVTSLVLIVVLLVALPMGRFMINTQQRSLADGLLQSTRVLVESLASGAGKYLPEENTIELGRLPAQSRAAEDALYATITGVRSTQVPDTDNDYFDYLWATNDPSIAEKLTGEDAGGGQNSFRRGAARIKDDVSPFIDELRERIDDRAEAEVGALSQELAELQEKARDAATRLVTRRDEDTAQLLQELQDSIASVSEEIEATLQGIGSEVSSVPAFDPETILTGPSEYSFYRPIVYQDSNRPGVYYHGLVRLGITTERIRGEIIASRDRLIRQTAVIALGAVLLGILGSLLLAAIIIIPIRTLVRGVEVISETDDKEKLKDHVIVVKTRDELSQLAETINEMTRGLVKAESAKKDLTIGKEVQKMFIPLEQDSRGNKKTTASDNYPGLNFFGYYEGAKGVSGDYFDYMQLPGNLYAVIKCDIAGKGVPASLIMVEVATIFRNFLNEWKREQERILSVASSKGIAPRKQEPAIDQLVASINSLVQERGFQGRFAALIVVLIDGATGKTVFCNAGDNQVHLYQGKEESMEMMTLPAAPAAGGFPNDLIDMKGGFSKVPHVLRSGDKLFLFTDGLEEAQRKFRNERFEVVTCEEPGLEQGQLHDTHPVGNDNEELGIPRIHEIINTFYRKGRYRLEKYHNPIPGEVLEFDFASCGSGIEDAVLALVAVEKIFRLNPDPKAGESDVVNVDIRIDDFLQCCFVQFEHYFGGKEIGRNDTYITYGSLKEDEQYDDLTVLGIEKV